MKLLKIKYQPTWESDWELDELELNPNVNLLVGQNTSGKTKTLNRLSILSYLLTGFDKEENIPIGIWKCSFLTDDSKKLDYYCEIEVEGFEDKEDLSVPIEFRIGTSWYIEEKLTVDKKQVLTRTGTEGKIYSATKKRNEKISPPFDALVIQVRRDKLEYPFFENLVRWAKGFKLFGFSNIQATQNKENEYRQIGKFLNQLPENQRKQIVKDIQTVGYDIEEIIIDKTWNDEYYFSIKERGIESKIYESWLSQGLMRTIALLVFIEHSLYFNNISTIAIDDLGEGLDYERATKLGKLLVEKLENSNIQFIATSNDSFLMDVVPIKYWNILQRDGNTVRALNYQNSKEQFDKFRMTGLSNFDLFSSDYLLQKL